MPLHWRSLFPLLHERSYHGDMCFCKCFPYWCWCNPNRTPPLAILGPPLELVKRGRLKKSKANNPECAASWHTRSAGVVSYLLSRGCVQSLHGHYYREPQGGPACVRAV